MHRFLASNIHNVPQSGLGKVWNKALELELAGKDVVNFGLGRPDFDTPQPIKQAAIDALNAGHVHYTVTRGIPELRQEISNDLNKRLGVDVDPASEIIVTVGAVEAISDIFVTLLDKGDEVIIPEPMYPFYNGWAEFHGGKTVGAPLSEENGFQITEEALRKAVTDQTKIIIVNSPCNPTGVCQQRESLEAVAKIAKEFDLLVVSDEVYDLITYAPNEHLSMLTFEDMRDRTIMLNSFSKGYCMDGWRVGYLVGPAELLIEMDKFHLRASTCVSSMVQWGALEALKQGPELVADNMERLNKRREFIVSMINDAPGLSCAEPQGAFYIWLNYGDVGLDEWGVSDMLLDEALVACTPGVEFGKSCTNHLRISYATSRANIEKGMTRMIEAFNKHRK